MQPSSPREEELFAAALALPQADTEAMQLHLNEISRHVAAGDRFFREFTSVGSDIRTWFRHSVLRIKTGRIFRPGRSKLYPLNRESSARLGFESRRGLLCRMRGKSQRRGLTHFG